MHQMELRKKDNYLNMDIIFGLLKLTGILTMAYILYKKKKPLRKRIPGKKINIEIRYETEKDADATFLAQNIAKVVRMVLVPVESQIVKEDAKLILVFTGDSWEMRMRKASEQLKHSVSSLLSANEW
ncbi:MAG: hypothetical protein WKF97_21835 [Chitinophagaceae bacterium]